MSYDTSSSTRTFLATERVLIKMFNNTGPKWLPGHIIQPVEPLSYLVKLTDGHIFRHHIDHLQKVQLHKTLFLIRYQKIILMCFLIKLHRLILLLVGILLEIDTFQIDTGFEAKIDCFLDTHVQFFRGSEM